MTTMRLTPRILAAAFVALVALKLALLLTVGPQFMPDSRDYSSFADLMLAQPDWLHHANLAVQDITSSRMFGYPLILAAAKLLFGGGWVWAVVITQNVAGIAAAVATFAAARALLHDDRWALAVAVAYVLSPALQFDLFVLTDSFYACCLTLLTALVVGWWARDAVPTVARGLAAGVLLVPAFLLREATMPLGLVFAAPVLAWAWRGRGPRGLAVVVAFCLPLAGGVAVVKAWNQARTGEAFVTTGTRTALLLPLLSMAGRGEPVFEGDNPLDDAARRAMAASTFAPSEYGIREALAANSLLIQQGWSSLDIARAVDHKFRDLLMSHPLAVVRTYGRWLASEASFLPFNPPRILRELLMWRDSGEFEGIRRFAARLVAERRPTDLLFAAIELPARLVGGGLTLTFAAAPLLLALRRRRDTLLLLALWAAAGAFASAYLMVYVEPRYLIGLLPALLLVAVAVLKTRDGADATP